MDGIDQPYSRYLRLLGFEGPPSGIEGLQQLVLRHLCRVPFENVSKLLLVAREGTGRVTSLGEFLDGIEQYDLGGTCYTSNPFLSMLLRTLGYDADLLGADMAEPNVHTVIRVRIGTARYHVDVGYAAPFREPVQLDRLPHEIRQGTFRYVLERDRNGDEVEVSFFSGGERLHGYVAHEPPRAPDFFRKIVLESFQPGRTFMACLRIARFFPDHAVDLKDRTLIRHRGSGSSRVELRSLPELRSAVRDEFAMARCPIEEAVESLERITGRRFFEE